MIKTLFSPKHRRSVMSDSTPTDAGCECRPESRVCPRHQPAAYADHMARHATDSIGPIRTVQQDRAAEFHNSNQFGR